MFYFKNESNFYKKFGRLFDQTRHDPPEFIEKRRPDSARLDPTRLYLPDPWTSLEATEVE